MPATEQCEISRTKGQLVAKILGGRIFMEPEARRFLVYDDETAEALLIS